MFRSGLLLIAASYVLIGATTSRAMLIETTSIDFDDGLAGDAIGSFYANLGVDFVNARWRATQIPTISPPLAIDALAPDGPDNTHFGQGSAIAINFNVPVLSVAIVGHDIGTAGATVEAYDLSGTFLTSQTAFGSAGVGGETNVSFEFDLPGVRQLRLFQPNYNGSDGVVFDNLLFTTAVIPEPSALVFWSALTAITALRSPLARRRIRRQCRN
ncbi:MAG: hypothetical protein AAF266_09110 [Planctomycetota bacterium]